MQTIAEKFAEKGRALGGQADMDAFMQALHEATKEEIKVLGRRPGAGVIHVFADDSALDDADRKVFAPEFVLDLPRKNGCLVIDPDSEL